MPEQPDHDQMDQIVEEFTARVRAGETPAVADYQKKYPQWADELNELLTSVAMIEGLKEQSHSVAASSGNRYDEVWKLDRLGEYRIVKELGRGGMGIVLEAVHESLGRRVAIKVLPHRLVNNQTSIERFTREARAAATLHHNNIVSVFGVGHSEGYYFYVMEFIDGRPLDLVLNSMRATTQRDANATAINPTIADVANLPDSIESNDRFSLNNRATTGDSRAVITNLPKGLPRFQWAAQIAADIADALQYAHDQGVLHRDIKPGNLMLDPAGRVWLTDFGLVKDISSQTMTAAGDIVGTPQYMAPESFESKYDVPSETWCLGATLYEMVTLQPVCKRGTAAEMIHQITTNSPIPARKIDPRIPKDLETILKKALERQPVDRYQSAEAFRDDLQAFLAGRPIAAKRTPVVRRVWLWCKRNPWQTISAALVATTAILATVGFVDRSRSFSALSDKHNQVLNEQNRTREQFERAEANVDLSLEMIDEMFRQVVQRGTGRDESFNFDGLEELNGIEPTVSTADAELLENMLKYLDRFANQNLGNGELRAESAKAFRRVANVYHLLRKPNEAMQAYQQSLNIQQEMVGDHPNEFDIALDRIRTANEMGQLAIGHEKPKQLQQMLTGIRRMQDASPFADELPFQVEVVRTLNLLGRSAPISLTSPTGMGVPQRKGFRVRPIRGSNARLGRENLRQLEAAVELVDQLIEKHGHSESLVLERAKSQARLAELLFILRRKSDSHDAHENAIADLQSLDLENANADLQWLITQTYAMPIEKPIDQNIDELQIANQLIEQLRDEDERNSRFMQMDANIKYQLAQLLTEKGDSEAAIQNFESALELMTSVRRRAPNNFRILSNLNDLTIELASLLMNQQNYVEARNLLVTNIARIDLMLRNSSPTPKRNSERDIPTRVRLPLQKEMLQQCKEAISESGGNRPSRRRLRGKNN